METNKATPNEVNGAGVSKLARLMTEAEARDTFAVARPLYTRYAPGLSSEAGRAITRAGVWSGLGFVGASIAAAGLLVVTNGGATVGVGLALLVAGGALATYAWRKSWNVIDSIDQVVAPVTAPGDGGSWMMTAEARAALANRP
jgi:hypothetical protein